VAARGGLTGCSRSHDRRREMGQELSEGPAQQTLNPKQRPCHQSCSSRLARCSFANVTSRGLAQTAKLALTAKP